MFLVHKIMRNILQQLLAASSQSLKGSKKKKRSYYFPYPKIFLTDMEHEV
jgi:hypothetical protein